MKMSSPFQKVLLGTTHAVILKKCILQQDLYFQEKASEVEIIKIWFVLLSFVNGLDLAIALCVCRSRTCIGFATFWGSMFDDTYNAIWPLPHPQHQQIPYGATYFV